MYTAVQVQSLAAEADAAICRAKEITKSKTVEDSAGIRTLEYALMLNRSYRRALFSVLERKLQRREEQEMNEEYRLNLKQQFSEGILLACVSCIWLYGKLDRWNRGLQVVSQNAQKLAVLLVPSVQSPLTERKGHEDVLKQLQSVLSSNSRAWKMFAYSWKAAIWIQERDAPSSLPEVPENFSRDIPGSRLSKELGPNHSSTELEVKQMIFKSFVLDHHLRHSRRQLCTEDYYDIHRKRDAWLREASGIVKNSQYAQSDLANKLKNLRHLFELVDRFQDPMHRRSLDGNYLVVNNDFLKEMSETLIKDAAISNMVGCLLSHLNDTRAMEFFHKALCIDPSRQGTLKLISWFFQQQGQHQIPVKI